ncbi:MAG: P1 family peptidase [Pseudomonadota bacterium]
MRNLITDVAGIVVGNAQDDALASGVTVLSGPKPLTCGIHVMGGAPGTRETDLLAPDKTVQEVEALVLSGGSAFGLAAADGVADALRREGRGFRVGDAVVPIVPAAILFDLLNGGETAWEANPYAALGQAALAASSADFALGTAGAGYGATLPDMAGGLGSASTRFGDGTTVGALVAVNAFGTACHPETGQFWAALFEENDEFGGRGAPTSLPFALPTKLGPFNTTIAIIATDAALTQAECTRLATAAHDGMARALLPSHTPMDGDAIFAASTGTRKPTDLTALCHAAATTLSRAIARGVYEATGFEGGLPPWQAKFGASGKE